MANKIVLFVVLAFLTQGAFSEPTEEKGLLTSFFTELCSPANTTKNMQVVIDCFTTQRVSFENLVNYLQTLTSLVNEEIQKGVRDNHYTTRTQTISSAFKQLSETVWPYVLQGNFQKALEGANKTATTVNDVANEMMKKLRKKNRSVFDATTKKFDDINAHTARKSKFMTVSVKNCIQKGSPFASRT